MFFEEPVNTFSWSLSRDGKFNDCLRGYYYQYYASFDWWKRMGIPKYRQTREYQINVLKHLTNKEMWIGQIVHEMIEVVIHNLHDFGKFNYSQADEIIIRKMQNDWRNSQDKYVLYDPKAFVGLQEHFYNQSIAENDFHDALNIVRQSIINFYSMMSSLEILAKSNNKNSTLEKLDSFVLMDTPIWIKVDLLVRNQSNATIIDWKSGKSDKESESTDKQLGIYAFYVEQQYRIPCDKIQAWEVNVRNGSIHRHTIDHEKMDMTAAYISDSIHRMQELLTDTEKNKADVQSFPMRSDRASCSSCNYRAVCYPSTYPFPRMPD